MTECSITAITLRKRKKWPNHRNLFELLSEHQRESDIEMVKQGEEEDRALNSYFKVGSSEGDLRYVNYYIAVIFQYFWKLTRLHGVPALQYWNSSSGKWEINQKQRQQSSSPISKPDAAERRGSVSADEQAQVAVWKSRNTETELAASDGNQKAHRREGDGAQSRKTEEALGDLHMKRFTVNNWGLTEELQSAATAGDDIISHKFTNSNLHRLQIAGKACVCVQHPVNFLKTLQK